MRKLAILGQRTQLGEPRKIKLEGVGETRRKTEAWVIWALKTEPRLSIQWQVRAQWTKGFKCASPRKFQGSRAIQEVKSDNPRTSFHLFHSFFFIVKILMEVYFQPQNGAAELWNSLNISQGLRVIEELGHLEVNDGNHSELEELGQTKETMVRCVQENSEKGKTIGLRVRGQVLNLCCTKYWANAHPLCPCFLICDIRRLDGNDWKAP